MASVYTCRLFHTTLLPNPDPKLRSESHYAHAACNPCHAALNLSTVWSWEVRKAPCVDEFGDADIAMVLLARQP